MWGYVFSALGGFVVGAVAMGAAQDREEDPRSRLGRMSRRVHRLEQRLGLEPGSVQQPGMPTMPLGWKAPGGNSAVVVEELPDTPTSDESTGRSGADRTSSAWVYWNKLPEKVSVATGRRRTPSYRRIDFDGGL